MTEQKIGVVGGGLMGHGIAYLFAAAGHTVGVFEPAAEIRATLPKRLQAIADLFGDDPALLKTVSVHDRLGPAVADTDLLLRDAGKTPVHVRRDVPWSHARHRRSFFHSRSLRRGGRDAADSKNACRALSVTGCSTRSSAKPLRSLPPASATLKPSISS